MIDRYRVSHGTNLLLRRWRLRQNDSSGSRLRQRSHRQTGIGSTISIRDLAERARIIGYCSSTPRRRPFSLPDQPNCLNRHDVRRFGCGRNRGCGADCKAVARCVRPAPRAVTRPETVERTSNMQVKVIDLILERGGPRSEWSERIGALPELTILVSLVGT